MKDKRLKIFGCCIVVIIPLYLSAQTPSNDASWNSTPMFEEQFNSYNDMLVDWSPDYGWGNTNNGLEVNLTQNLSVSSGTLKIKSDDNAGYYDKWWWSSNTQKTIVSTHFDYTSGVIKTRKSYDYGFYEIRCELPKGRGLWPAFWMLSSGNCWYNEIDVVEPGGLNSTYADEYGANYHWKDFSTCQRYPRGRLIDNLPDLSQSMNTYAVEWSPGLMIWYFNGEIVEWVKDDIYTPTHSMPILVNVAIDPYYKPNSSTSFPQYMTVDWVKVHDLKIDCSKSEHIRNSTDISNYSSAVKKSVRIGGSGYSPTISTNNNLTIRATDFVTIDKGATINPGSSGHFTIIVSDCP